MSAFPSAAWAWLVRLACGLLVLALVTAAAAAERNVAVVATKSPAAQEPRHALVIGNADYPNAALANPVNDARAMADRLTGLRFQVVRLENATQEQMYEAIRSFGDQLRGGGVGLFYYAGHALQVRGRNFLLPARAKIEREDEIAYRTVDTGQILDKMESAHNRVNIVILDACRNNPFGREFRNVAPGLAVVDAPANTLIAFATAPGAVASDGSGPNGLYTQHLLASMAEPGLGLEDVFKKVRAGVRRESAGRQVPWESTSLEVDFHFMPSPPSAAAAGPASDTLALELAFWDSVKGSSDPEDFRAYLQRYPDGPFAVLARNRLRGLGAPAAGVAVLAPAPAAAAPGVQPPLNAPSPVAPVTVAGVHPTLAPPLTAPTLPAATPPQASAAPAPVPAAGAVPTAAVPARTLLGHTGEVLAVAVSRSGTLALTSAADRGLRLWDLATGTQLRRFGTEAAVLAAVAIAPDGRQLLSGGSDRRVRLWDAASGTELARMDGHAATVSAVVFGPTARYAVTAAADGEVIVWELPAGRIIRRASAQPGRIGSVALSADGRYLLTASDDGNVRQWDVGTLTVLRNFGPMAAPAAAVAFGDGARRVSAVDAQGELWSWQAASGALAQRFATAGRAPVLAALAADGATALTAAADGQLALWDTVSGRALWRSGTNDRRLTAVALGPRGSIGLSAADDKRLLLWTMGR